MEPAVVFQPDQLFRGQPEHRFVQRACTDVIAGAQGDQPQGDQPQGDPRSMHTQQDVAAQHGTGVIARRKLAHLRRRIGTGLSCHRMRLRVAAPVRNIPKRKRGRTWP